MNREELAAQIFAVSCYKGGQPCADSFAQADKFLDYAAKQRKPKACEHRWVSINNGPERCFYCDAKLEPSKSEPDCKHKWVSDGGECYYCQKCDVPKVKVDKKSAKPEQVAREWWIRYPVLKVGGACVPEVWPDSDKHANIFENDKWIKVREILPEDEHDKR